MLDWHFIFLSQSFYNVNPLSFNPLFMIKYQALLLWLLFSCMECPIFFFFFWLLGFFSFLWETNPMQFLLAFDGFLLSWNHYFFPVFITVIIQTFGIILENMIQACSLYLPFICISGKLHSFVGPMLLSYHFPSD